MVSSIISGQNVVIHNNKKFDKECTLSLWSDYDRNFFIPENPGGLRRFEQDPSSNMRALTSEASALALH
ncbi:hypothetical protein Leryth_026047 [Lithospermum erythrorhizon]|nr:hypothetical protein Leryth_026047 [Lithospermum erythrorhizon]